MLYTACKSFIRPGARTNVSVLAAVHFLTFTLLVSSFCNFFDPLFSPLFKSTLSSSGQLFTGTAYSKDLSGLSFTSEIIAGFSEAEITPEEETTMGGYGTFFINRRFTRLSKGTHDPLLASIAIFKTSVSSRPVFMISLDLVGLSPALENRIREQIRKYIGRDFDLLVSATHTHASPDTVGLWGALPSSGVDPDYLDEISAKIGKAAFEAMGTAEKVSVSHSTGEILNTSDDPEVNAVSNTFWFERANGEVKATLTQWNAHPTVLGGDNHYFSAGFVGPFRAYMSKKFPGTHLYFNGILGGVFPPDLAPAAEDPFETENGSIYDPGVELSVYLQMTAVGKALSDNIFAQYAQKSPVNLSKGLQVKRFDFSVNNDNFLYRLAMRLDILEDRGHRSSVIESHFSVFDFGEFSFLAIPGESFSEPYKILAKAVKRKNVIPIGIAGDWLGYIMTEDQYNDPEYDYFKTLSPSAEALSKMLEAVNQ